MQADWRRFSEKIRR